MEALPHCLFSPDLSCSLVVYLKAESLQRLPGVDRSGEPIGPARAKLTVPFGAVAPLPLAESVVRCGCSWLNWQPWAAPKKPF
jgi:hypothetical protein